MITLTPWDHLCERWDNGHISDARLIEWAHELLRNDAAIDVEADLAVIAHPFPEIHGC